MKTRVLFLTLAICMRLAAQDTLDLRRSDRSFPYPERDALPGSCFAGQVVRLTTTHTVYLCNPLLLWTPINIGQYDVRNGPFYAKCDGSTNDAVALQAALDAGGPIEIPATHVCVSNSALTISQNNTFLFSYASQRFVTGDSPTSYIDFRVTNANGLIVSSQGFVMRDVGLKYPIGTGAPVPTESAPSLAATTGVLTARAYYVEVTCITAQGSNKYSAEATITLGSTGGITVTKPACSGGTAATGWDVWMATNSQNETKQNTTAISLSSDWTQSVALTNNGYRNIIDASANCAIRDSAAGKYHHVMLFTGAVDGDVHGVANGLCLTGSSAEVDDGSSFTGFSVGLLAANNVNNLAIEKSFFQANGYGIVVGNGDGIRLGPINDFEANQNGNVWVVSGSSIGIVNSYFEQQLLAGTTAFNIKIGDSTSEPISVGQAHFPYNVEINNSFLQCNGVSATPPIIVQGILGLTVANNNTVNCTSVATVINNAYANAAAGISLRHNVNQSAVTAFIDSLVGVTDYDYSISAKVIGALNIPSLSITPTNGGLGLRQAPPWLQFFGDGSDGVGTCSGNLTGEKWYTSFTVAFGNTCTNNSSSSPLIIRATGTCTIAGTLNARGADAGFAGSADWGGSGGGGGGGTGAGSAGSNTQTQSIALLNGGSAGATSGGAAGNGTQPGTIYRHMGTSMPTGYPKGGSQGGAGGSSGGAGGKGGQVIILACNAIDFTGAISVVGANGGDSPGNNQGSGGGGGGGYIILSTLSYTHNTGSLSTTGGSTGSCGAFTGCGAGGTGGAGWSTTITIQ